MRVLSLLLAAAFIAGMLLLAGCGDGKETPAGGESGESGETGDKKEGDSGAGKTAAEGEGSGESGEGDGEEGDGEDGEEGDGETSKAAPEIKDDRDRLWPDHPKAREILTDPNDDSKSSSYWINAKMGDWVRFLNWRKNIIIYRVVKREGNNIEFSVKEYKRSGEEIPEEQEDIRKTNIEEDSKLMKSSAIQNRYVERYVYEWPVYNTDKTLYCERRWVPNPMTGENNDTCRAWEVRCGGLVYQRRGNNTYVILIDYGDAEHPPKWDHLDPADMFKYWHRYDRFLHQKFIPQEDPDRGEEPEMPEDMAPAELVEKLKQIDKLVGKELKNALMGNRLEDAAKSLEQMAEPMKEAVSFAEKNNYKPAVLQAEVVNRKTGELVEACKQGESEKALAVLKELRAEVLWFHTSLGHMVEQN